MLCWVGWMVPSLTLAVLFQRWRPRRGRWSTPWRSWRVQRSRNAGPRSRGISRQGQRSWRGQRWRVPRAAGQPAGRVHVKNQVLPWRRAGHLHGGSQPLMGKAEHPRTGSAPIVIRTDLRQGQVVNSFLVWKEQWSTAADKTLCA